jgi:hypothetical protein
MNSEPELSADILAALRANRKIEAIKLLREQRDLGLKEAKHIIDIYIAKQPSSSAGRSRQSEFGIARLLFAGVVTAAIYALYRYFS